MIAFIFLWIIIALHLYFAWLEMSHDPVKLAKSFELPQETLENPLFQMGLANQGVYNLAFALVLAFTLLVRPDKLILSALMGFVLIVGLYGGATVNHKIWLLQALPGLIGLIFVILFL